MTKRKSLDFDAFQPRSEERCRVITDINVDEWPSREPQKTKSRAVEQIAMRVPKEDLDLFNQLASEGNFSKPQLLRRLMRVYQDCEKPKAR